jgi:hypothetical protein
LSLHEQTGDKYERRNSSDRRYNFREHLWYEDSFPEKAVK